MLHVVQYISTKIYLKNCIVTFENMKFISGFYTCIFGTKASAFIAETVLGRFGLCNFGPVLWVGRFGLGMRVGSALGCFAPVVSDQF